MKQDTIVKLKEVLSINTDFNQLEDVIQSCVDGIFRKPGLEDKLFKRYFKTLTHFTELWCGNYNLMNHCIDKMNLDMPLKDYPWECDVCRKYARLIVIALEMSCNLSGRCDKLKESDLVEYEEDGDSRDLRYDLKRAKGSADLWKKKAFESVGDSKKLTTDINDLKKKLEIEEAKNKQFRFILKGVDQL
jgi:hypothetical protein